MGDSVSREEAQMACQNWHARLEKKGCICDVVATGDLDLAQAGAC